MHSFTLNDEHLTGMDSLDDQHRLLLQRINLVLSDSVAHFGHAWFCDALGGLLDYAHYHFAAEEYLMRRLGYPGFKAHRNWHDAFRLELNEIVDTARRSADTSKLQARLTPIFRGWLAEHVRDNDRPLAVFARARVSAVNLRLADSATLRRAGLLVAEVEQTELATGTSPRFG